MFWFLGAGRKVEILYCSVFNEVSGKEQTKMNGATAGLLPPPTRHIPTRRIEVHDPSHMPSAYSTTPGGTIFSTTPGGKCLKIVLCNLVYITVALTVFALNAP